MVFLSAKCHICMFSWGGWGVYGSLWRSFGLKRRQIAKLMEVSPATISKYSCGYPPRFAYERLIKLLDPLLSLREQKLKERQSGRR